MGKPKKHLEPLEIETKPRQPADSQPPAGPVFHWPEGAQPPGDTDSNVPPLPLDGMGLISMAKHVGAVLDKRKRRVDSHRTPIPERSPEKPTITFDQTPQPTNNQRTGDTTAAALAVDASGGAPTRACEPDYMVIGRLTREGRWKEVSPIRDAMVSEARSKGMSLVEARAWTYSELDRLYPPLPPKEEPVEAPAEPQPAAERIAGLGEIPSNWPQLPDNASLQAELGWVQSQRLRVVEERGNSTVVHLERSSCPAPSMAALGWLETSIRSYAKYVDIIARALSTQQDEQEHVRRERTRIEDIRALLREMHDDGGHVG